MCNAGRGLLCEAVGMDSSGVVCCRWDVAWSTRVVCCQWDVAWSKVQVVSSLSELYLCFILGQTFPSAKCFTPLVHTLMGCVWLVFLVLYHLLYTSLWHWSLSEMLSKSGWRISLIKMSLLVPVTLNSKPYLLQCSWKLLKALTEIDTCWRNNRQRNGCLFTWRLSLKIINEGTKCCSIDLQCIWKQSQKAKFVWGQIYTLCQTYLTN
jgi:hypothetical protein